MAEYSSLLSDLSDNITNEDLEQLKSACKEDIPEDQSNNITSSKEWFSYLEKNDKLAQGEVSNHPSTCCCLPLRTHLMTAILLLQIICHTSSTSLRFQGDRTCWRGWSSTAPPCWRSLRMMRSIRSSHASPRPRNTKVRRSIKHVDLELNWHISVISDIFDLK